MRKYYRQNYYSQNNSIKSFRDLVAAFVQLWVWLVLLFLLQYIIPAYIYIIEHPIFLIPVGIAVLVIAGGVYYYREQRKRIRYRAIQKFSDIMKQSPREFEEYIEQIFKKKWYETVLGSGIKDWWVDVTATLDGKTYYIQCKHYKDANIKVEEVRELCWVVKKDESNYALWIFVTTTFFTREALEFAHDCERMELWDRDYLIKYLSEEHKVN